MPGYDDAVIELSQVPLDQYIAERKRLAGELKAAGDKTGARVLGTRARPPVSAWAVNQLYWHAREAFDELLATAARLRKGELAASGAHRDALAKLRKRAATILEDAGHNANEATLRRVATTLSAIAASGDWGEDKPGTIVADRDPPGFEAVGIPAETVAEVITAAATPAPAKPHSTAAPQNDNAESKDDTAQRLAAEMAEKRAAEEQRKRIAAEKHRLETAVREAKTELHERERTVKSLEAQLRAATEKVDDAQQLIANLERKLDDL